MAVTQWKNHNRYRSYPFVENSDMVGLFGAQPLTLPDNTLLDFALISYLLEEGDYSVVLVSLSVAAGGASVTFNFMLGAFHPMPITVSAAIVPPYEAEFRLDVTPGTGWLIARPIFGEGVVEIAADAANHGKTFTFNTLNIEPATYSQMAKSLVTSISVEGGIELLDGDVKILEGYNMKVDFNDTTNELTIGAGIGAGAGIPCSPQLTDPADCPEGIFYLNGRHPDWWGKFFIQAGPGIEVEAFPASNKIVISSLIRADKPRCKDPE